MNLNNSGKKVRFVKFLDKEYMFASRHKISSVPVFSQPALPAQGVLKEDPTFWLDGG